MGREKATVTKGIRFDPAELAAIEQAAARLGLDFSSYIRMLAYERLGDAIQARRCPHEPATT